jgi:hypothetical protein
MTFDSVLRADWNADGKVDGLALLRAAQGEAQPVGSVYLYDGGGDARKLFDLPGWIPSSQNCTWDSRLLRVGKHTATVDINVRCTAPMPPRTPTRYLGVVSPFRGEPTVISWRIAEPAPDESFDVTVSGLDRDGDETDDVTLTLALGLASDKNPIRAEFAWLDRAAGISREPSHFANSLGPTLSALEKQSISRGSAAEATAGAALIWRLLGSACAESATARVYRGDGSALPCENTGTIAGRLIAIEVRAALSQNDVLKATFAMTRAQNALGASLSVAERSRLVKSVRKSTVSLETISATASEVRPILPRTTPHFSPLQFQPDGTLLVETSHGVRRIQSDGQELPGDEDAAVPPDWPTTVVAGDGRSWDSLLPACDRSEMLVVTKGPSGDLQTPEVTRYLAPRPGICAGVPSLGWRISPIRFDEGQLPLALIEGACLTTGTTDPCLKPSLLGKVVPGSPRSPDGHWLVAMTGIGFLILGGPKPELWEGSVIGNPHAWSDCVVANGGERVACLKASHLWLFSKSAAPTNEDR